MKATFKLNQKLNGIEISFEAKPSEEIRNNLKANGFRWSTRNAIWYTKQSETALAFAQSICGTCYATPGTETKPAPVNMYGVKVGDLFVEMFGYDATIHNFYQVVSLKGKCMIELREVGCESRTTGFCSWDTRPIKGKFIGDPITKKTKPGWDGKSILAGNMSQGSWDEWYENDNYH